MKSNKFKLNISHTKYLPSTYLIVLTKYRSEYSVKFRKNISIHSERIPAAKFSQRRSNISSSGVTVFVSVTAKIHGMERLEMTLTYDLDTNWKTPLYKQLHQTKL